MTTLNTVQYGPTWLAEPPTTPTLVKYTTLRDSSYQHYTLPLNAPPRTLSEQLTGRDVVPATEGSPSTNIDTLSRHFLDNLTDSPQYAALQKLHRQLLLGAKDANDLASLGKKEAQACYEYFKAAQHAFEDPAHKPAEKTEQRDLCRMLKWQFRASRDQRSKTVLDQAMAQSRIAVAEGGSMSHHAKLGVGAGVLGSLKVVPSVGLSTTLGTTQGRIIRDTSSVSAGLAARLSAGPASAQVGVELEKSTIRKYGNIDDYASARSLSKWTWWNGSKRDMLTQSRNLFASCNHYKRNTRLAAQSRPHLEKELQGKGFDLKFEQHKPKAQPFQIERGARVALTGSVQFEGLGVVTPGATAKADVLRTTKNQAMDIVALYDWSSDEARPQLGSPHEYHTTPEQLIEDLRKHVADSSEKLTRAKLKNQDARERRILKQELDDQTLRLQKQFIQLMTSGKIIGKDTRETGDTRPDDADIRQLLADHPMLLRPDSLKRHTAKTDTKVRTLSAEAKLKVAVGVSAEAAVQVSLQSIKDDDPHYSGTYLDLTFSGQINTLESLQNLVSSGLSRIGANGFDPAPVLTLIASTALYQSHGVSQKFSLKIKDGKPALLMSQRFFTQKDNISQAIDTPTPLTVEVGFGGHLDTLLSEQLGSQSLDLVLQLALAKLGNRTEAGIEWWDQYVDKHAQSFDKMLNDIASDNENTLICRELVEIMNHISQDKWSVVSELLDTAKAARDHPDHQTLKNARDALKQVFHAYIDDYYDAKVKEAWRVE